MKLTHNGQVYDITNWDEFSNKLLTAIGFQVENEIRRNINEMKLVDTGSLKTGVHSEVINGELIITDNAPHAVYIEYGTYDYWSRFGKDRFPKTTDPKKKDSTQKVRDQLPKGMQPFAPFRKTLYNQQKMSQIVEKAIKAAK